MAATANAAALRTFVSGFGNDSNTATNCSHAQPCRTFAMAVTVTSSGGEIEALDPAGYGPVTITGPLTLIGLPGAAINAPSGGNGITINAQASDVVHVQGLLIDGGGIGSNGIVLNTGGSLTVTNCVVQNLTAHGVAITPTSGTTTAIISNTFSLNNGANGIIIGATGSANVGFSIDQTTASKNNSNGIDIDASASNGRVLGMITDSHVDYNSTNGIAGIGHTGFFNVYVHVKNSFAIGNSNIGILAQNTGTAVAFSSGAGIILDNDYIIANDVDVESNSSSVFTFGNNVFGSTSGSALTSASHR